MWIHALYFRGILLFFPISIAKLTCLERETEHSFSLIGPLFWDIANGAMCLLVVFLCYIADGAICLYRYVLLWMIYDGDVFIFFVEIMGTHIEIRALTMMGEGNFQCVYVIIKKIIIGKMLTSIYDTILCAYLHMILNLGFHVNISPITSWC